MDKLTPERRSWLMGRVKSKNTIPEMIVRRLVFAMGYRYRLHDKRFAGKPDLAFIGRRKVIFVNGCFWHGHEGCPRARMPSSRTEYWNAKIERNRTRDKENLAQLATAGWTALTLWECELGNLSFLEQRLRDFLEGN